MSREPMPSIGKHLAVLNLFREADGSVQVTVASAQGATAEMLPAKANEAIAPANYVDSLIVEAAFNILKRRPDLDDGAKDRVLEECAEICEGVTHWGLSPTKAEVAKSTQSFCAKAIRAQKSDSAERAALKLQTSSEYGKLGETV